MPKPKLTTRQKLKAAYDAHEAGNPKPLKALGLKPIPDSFKGPAKGKGGAGRPRTGNKAIQMDRKTGTEIMKGASMDHAYNRFLEGIPEPELHQALATASPAPLKKNKYQQALTLLTHPRIMKQTRRSKDGTTGTPGEWSVAAILKHTGVTLIDLMDMYGRYRTAHAVRIAMDRSPTIIAHAADDAENRQVVCPRCDGFGTLSIEKVEEDNPRKGRKPAIPPPTIRTCPECDGQGTVNQSGDADARKLVLEVAGIVNKKGPVVDARSVHYGHGVFNVEALVKGMEQLENPQIEAGPDSAIIDAEVEEVEE